MDEKLIQEIIDKRLKPLQEKIAAIEHSLTFVSDNYSDLQKKVKHLEAGDKVVNKLIQAQQADISALRNDVAAIKNTLNDHEQYSRRDCLEIRGVPELPDTTSKPSTNMIVKEIGRLTGIEIKDADISTSHRLKENQSRNEAPAIIVKFISRDLRNKLYAAKKNLKNKSCRDLKGFERQRSQSLFISESLTKQNRELLNKCLQTKKKYYVKFVWTFNGRILMRQDTSHPAVTIVNERDLQKFTSGLQPRNY